MSDESAKTVGTEPGRHEWETPEKIAAFFCLNLLAAYAPAVVCFMAPPDGSTVTMFLISPVAFACLATDVLSTAGDWYFLAAFMLLLFWASAALHNSRKAWFAIPSIVFVYSLLQGMLFASAINGINALG